MNLVDGWMQANVRMLWRSGSAIVHADYRRRRLQLMAALKSFIRRLQTWCLVAHWLSLFWLRVVVWISSLDPPIKHCKHHAASWSSSSYTHTHTHLTCIFHTITGYQQHNPQFIVLSSHGLHQHCLSMRPINQTSNRSHVSWLISWNRVNDNTNQIRFKPFKTVKNWRIKNVFTFRYLKSKCSKPCLNYNLSPVKS